MKNDVDRVHGLYTVIGVRFTMTCDGKNSLEFECVVVVMHMSSLWMLGEEDGLFGDLTGHSSGW
jgi:hypothetical protein